MQALAPPEGPISPVLTSLREVPKRPRRFILSSSAVMPATENAIVADVAAVADDGFEADSSPEPSAPSFPPKNAQHPYEHYQLPSESNAEAQHFEHHNARSSGDERQLSERRQRLPLSETTEISHSAVEDTDESQHQHYASDQAVQPVHEKENDLRSSSTSVIRTSPLSAIAADCSTCQTLSTENNQLTRLVARLQMRMLEIRATAQTHGQRLLRAAYQDKIRQMSSEHAQQTTEMLNKQKACFEEEMEALERESHAAIHTLHVQLERERQEKDKIKRAFQHERDEAIEKTSMTMQAVQRKLAHLHAKVIRLERENAILSASQKEKQVMVEVLASAAAARDTDRREREMVSKSEREERSRKNMLIDSMNAEIKQLRARLAEETEWRRQLLTRLEELYSEREDDMEKHAEDLAECKQQSQKESDRLGRLFASVIQDFANGQSDVSTND